MVWRACGSHGVSIPILVGSSYKTCQIHLWYRCGENCVHMILSYPGLYSLYTVWYCRPVVCCLQYTCWFSSTLDQLNIRHYVETPLCLWHLSLSRFSACVIFLPLWFDLPLWFYCLRKRLFFAIVTLYSLWCAFSKKFWAVEKNCSRYFCQLQEWL